MEGNQLISLLTQNQITSNSFLGCFLNKNFNPDILINCRNGYCVLNTVSDVRKMGHWVLFYVRDNELLFIDSFALHPDYYGGKISLFYKCFPRRKHLFFKKAVQNSISLVCGGYVLVISYLLCKNLRLTCIKSHFSRNTKSNDKFIVRNVTRYFNYNINDLLSK